MDEALRSDNRLFALARSARRLLPAPATVVVAIVVVILFAVVLGELAEAAAGALLGSDEERNASAVRSGIATAMEDVGGFGTLLLFL